MHDMLMFMMSTVSFKVNNTVLHAEITEW